MIPLTTNPHTFTFEIFSQRKDVLVFVTSRLGGRSSSHLASCNIGLNDWEEASITIGNREKICRALAIDFSTLTFQNQVHEDRVTIVEHSQAGAGNRQKQNAIPNSDALITSTRGITLVAQAADCVPLALYDPQRKVAAAVHAGWRGTSMKIAQKTVLKMMETYSCNPTDILVGIGPSIGKCCFEVGSEVIASFEESHPAHTAAILLRNQRHVDLWEANKLQLMDVGLLPQNIEVAGICTKCNAHEFYSARQANGHTGRFGIGISIL